MALFIATKLVFDPDGTPEPSWIGTALNVSIFILWASACASTATCLYACRARRRAFAKAGGQSAQSEQRVAQQPPPSSVLV
jgi:hypothetical protein